MPSQDSATERFFKHYQKAAARGELEAEDLAQFHQADKLDREGKVNLPLKKIKLQGNYKSPTGSEDETGRCLRRALREAQGIDVENLPDVVDGADIPKICAELGLVLHTGPQQVELPKDKDVIVLYHTRDNSAHAIVTNNLPEFVKKGKIVIGIIEIPENGQNPS
ncbi:MAG: hypothetical protein M1484_01300 [Patescibacteria group bacterium]|nr:hypothetical protein [Patescibacteria group bacterium]MCL5431717.1 hypothetical protein [Patescibacteria group bacterium]